MAFKLCLSATVGSSFVNKLSTTSTGTYKTAVTSTVIVDMQATAMVWFIILVHHMNLGENSKTLYHIY